MKESKYTESSKVPFGDAWQFIIRVGLAAQKYGSTATRLESFLVELSRSFGYQGFFRSNPSEIIFAMRESPDLPQRVEVIATPPPDVILYKLALLGDLLNDYNAGTISLTEAYARIDAIEKEPPPWGKIAIMLGYAFVGVGLASLLGGGWMDILFATLFSILVYGIVLLSGRLGAVATEWMPLTTAFTVGFLATIISIWVPDLNILLVILSSVAIILPGYTISLGAGEIVAQHILSGAANLMSGLICLFKQVAGGWLGFIVASLVVSGKAAGPAAPVDSVWLWLFFPLLLIGLCFVFQTSRRDLPWAVLVCSISYLGIIAGSSILSANLGNLIGTIIAVVIANLWSRQTGRPASIVLIPAVVMLVSGSIGFRGLASMAGGEVLLGINQFFQMFIIALTITTGILIGYTIVRPEPRL